MTKTTFKVGDKVQILDVARILYAEKYFNDGDIATVKRVGSEGKNPTIGLHDTTDSDVYIMRRELPFIKKVEAPSFASKAGYELGDKVRILDVSKIMFGSQYFSDGEVTEVVGLEYDGRPRLQTKASDTYGLVILDKELPFVEKVTTACEVSTMPTRISLLESQVASLESKVRALETGNVDVYTAPTSFGTVTGRMSASPKLPPSPFTPNQHRASIIEQAKQFVEDVTARMYGERINHEGNETFRHRTTKPHFTTKGRTVTVVVKGSGFPTEYERASATCAEGDVFNEDIGRAIALGRAMGLRIPTAFTKAPQPSQVVAGMEVVTFYHDGTINKWCPTKVTHLHRGMPAFGNGSHSSHYKISDDTDAQYQSTGMGAF